MIYGPDGKPAKLDTPGVEVTKPEKKFGALVRLKPRNKGEQPITIKSLHACDECGYPLAFPGLCMFHAARMSKGRYHRPVNRSRQVWAWRIS